MIGVERLRHVHPTIERFITEKRGGR